MYYLLIFQRHTWKSPEPQSKLSCFANRLRAFHTFLEYCRQYELKVEFWDFHFSQGSYKQLQTNEKNKAKKYSDALRTFINRPRG